MNNTLDTKLLSELLSYNITSGKLYWVPRPIEQSSDITLVVASKNNMRWNTKFAFTEAFTTLDAYGYLRGRVYGKQYLAHRVIWAITTRVWPTHQIDHINGNRQDNRLANLREATQFENARNTKSRGGASSKYLGVSWNSSRRKWQVQIEHQGVSKYVGVFTDELAAARAYDGVALMHHGSFARLNFQFDEIALS
jgi:hypothetical protein